jgi:hydroxyethylthiazole kinase
VDIVANGLLAVGATPAMIHSPEEVPQVVSTLKDAHGALYINIGTLSDEWIK